MLNSKVHIYGDGSSRINPGGVGGWGVVLTTDAGTILHTMSGGEPDTTNTRMELMAIIRGLELVHLYSLSKEVIVYSDSRYVIDNSSKLRSVNSFGSLWITKTKESDLWERYHILDKSLNIEHIWVPGHTGHALQEIADTLATNASGDLKSWLEKKKRNMKRKFNFSRGKTSSTRQGSTPKTLLEVYQEKELRESLPAPSTTTNPPPSL